MVSFGASAAIGLGKENRMALAAERVRHDHRRTRASMELFAREVVPHFTGACRPRPRAHARELGHDQLTRRTMAKAQGVADL